MKVSLDGLMAGIETSLRSSKSDMACAYAYSLMEFAENLRLVRSGEATIIAVARRIAITSMPAAMMLLLVTRWSQRGWPFTTRPSSAISPMMRS
mgnify:CR=1 FL=1